MEDLLEALNTNGFAHVDATLAHVISNTMQDAQYSPGAHANLAVLLKYELEMGDWRVGEIKTDKVVPSKYY
jgi:hypothetical protein